MSDESLSVYVRRLLSQGYSREQVAESLRKSGYPESLIDATFRALESGSGGSAFGTSEADQPVNQQQSTQQADSFNTSSPNRHSGRVASLATYIKTYLQQGYHRDQLYSYLLQQDYSKREVDDAFSLASGKVIHEVHVAGSTVVKLAVLILFIAGITTVLFLLLGKGNVVVNTNDGGGGVGPATINHLLDLSLNLDESRYEPGAKMNVEIGATNMGTKQRFDVIFLLSVVGSDGTEILSGKETRALTDSISFNKRIVLPEDTPEGEFNMRVKADYDGKEAIASQLFNVEKSSSSTNNNPPESNTSDNGGSNNGEGPIIIIKDEPPDNVMEEANNAAKSGNSVKAERLCTSISNQARRDQCLNLIVLSDNEPSHCDAITSVSERESCYMLFIFNGRYTLCSKLTTQENKNLCENLKHLHDLPASSSSGGEEQNINDFT